MKLSALTAISPLDGRYFTKINHLSSLTSEYALIKARLQIEVEWLIFLANQHSIIEIKVFNETQMAFLRNLYLNFNTEEALKIKEIEYRTNHDVKAVEYYLKQCLESHDEYIPYLSYLHFACTSEDINNLSYGLMMQQSRSELLTPTIKHLLDKLADLGHEHSFSPMLSRTHGQSATPTTMGKELINFADRLNKYFNQFNQVQITGKMNGAVGNYNAHKISYENLNWPEMAQTFVESLGLTFNAYTTQINPHDDIAEFCHSLIRINNILLDLAKDVWGYISLGYFQQKIKPNEIGSSTMPHKVNPIDFENAEGNLGLANSLLEFFSNKLPISRWQRDLSDSTVLRNLGVAFGYSLVAYQSLLVGLGKLKLNSTLLNTELNNHWEILGEAIQTVMRRHGIDDAYEQLKDLTRGEKLTQNLLIKFIDSQELPSEIKAKLKQLTPSCYIGYAEKLAQDWKI